MTIRTGVLATALLVGMSAAALAAGAPSSGSAAGAGVKSKSEVITELQKEGYSHVELMPSAGAQMSGSSSQAVPGAQRSAAPSEWTGTAVKNGKTVHLTVNSAGHVTQESE